MQTLADAFAASIPNLLQKYSISADFDKEALALFFAEKESKEWKLTEQICLLNSVGKNEPVWNSVKDKFEAGQKKQVEFVGVFIVPNWAVVAVGMPVAGLPNLPCCLVAQNKAWETEVDDVAQTTIDLCFQAVGNEMTSPFRDMVRRNTSDLDAKLRVREAELDSSLDGQLVTAIYMAFEQTIEAEFETQIIY
jgi:hypothetical protein